MTGAGGSAALLAPVPPWRFVLELHELARRLAPMPRRALSDPWCLRCLADESEGAKLYAVHLARTYTGADGRRHTSTIPLRICRSCAEALVKASDKNRGDWLATSRHEPRARTVGGTFASRAQMAQASRGSSSSALVPLPMAATGRDR